MLVHGAWNIRIAGLLYSASWKGGGWSCHGLLPIPAYSKAGKEQTVEAHAHLSWKSLQKVVKPLHQCSTSLIAGPTRWGCQGLHPAQFWAFPRTGCPWPPWAHALVFHFPQNENRFSIFYFFIFFVIKVCCLTFCLSALLKRACLYLP